MGAWSEFLKRITPKSGRFIKESGEYENVADVAYRFDAANISAAVRDGVVYQANWRGQIPANDSIHFVQDVQTGYVIQGVAFSAPLSGGPVEYQLTVGSTAGADQGAVNGYNADRRRRLDPDFISVNSFKKIASVAGGVIVDESFVETPTSGVAKASAALTTAGIGGVYDSVTPPFFTLTNKDANNAAEVAISWIWKETQE